jgi:hypothetical protein
MPRAYRHNAHRTGEIIVYAELVGGGPYDGRKIDRRGDLPPEIVLVWPTTAPPFGSPPTGPRYCTYRQIAGTNRYKYEAP